MEYVNLIVQQLIIFAIFALIGIYAIKRSILDETGLNYLSQLIIKITLPIMLFYNTLTGATKEELLQGIPVIFISIIFYGILILICCSLKNVFHIIGEKGNVYLASSLFGNVGFIGIPIISSLFPQKGMLYIALFTIVDQLLLWTLGLSLTSKKGESTFQLKSLQKMINPSTIAIVLAIAFILFNIHLPQTFLTAFGKIGNVTSPLAMIYLGGIFCYIDLFDCFKQKEFYGTIFIKMLILPVLFYCMMINYTSFTQDLVMTMTVLMGLPTMSSVAMLAKSHECYGEYSSGCVLLTTIASLFTLPVICFVINFV